MTNNTPPELIAQACCHKAKDVHDERHDSEYATRTAKTT